MIKKINEGITGAEASDVIYGNDNQAAQNKLIQRPEIDFKYADTYVEQTSGLNGAAVGFAASDFIPLNGATKVRLTPGVYHQYALYDENKEFLNTDFSANYSTFFTRPEDAHFIRLSSRTTETELHQVNLYSATISREKAVNSIYTPNVLKFDNKYIGETTGEAYSVTGYSATDFLELPDNVLKIYVSDTYQQFAFFDENLSFINAGSPTTGGKIYDKPAGAKFARFSIRNGEDWYVVLLTKRDLVPSSPTASQGLVEVRVTRDAGNNAIQTAIDAITDATKTKRYALSVGPGLYKASNSSEYNNPSYPSFIIPKDHVDIVGDNKEDVIVWAELPYNDADIDTSANRNSHQTIYTWADDVTIKNITFVAKNTRYVLHQDSANEKNKTRYFENCDFIFIGDKSSLRAFGVGTWSASKTYVKFGKSLSHASFPAAFHNQAKQDRESVYSFENHTFETYNDNYLIYLQNSGSMVGDQFILKNCRFVGGYRLKYVDWWIYYPGTNDHFNGAEWRVIGEGNSKILFENTTKQIALAVRSKTIGAKVRFNTASSAYAALIANDKKYFGPLSNPEYAVQDGYVVFDPIAGLMPYAIGGKSIREENYIFGTTASQDKLGVRLGDCTTVNKVLGVTVGSTAVNITFNQNFTSQTNAQVLAFINAALGTVAEAYEHNLGAEYYAEFADVLGVYQNATGGVIPKGTAVRIGGGKIVPATGDIVDGITLDACQPYANVQGVFLGKTRVVKKCYLAAASLRLARGVTITKGTRYGATNGEIVVNPKGNLIGYDAGILEI